MRFIELNLGRKSNKIMCMSLFLSHSLAISLFHSPSSYFVCELLLLHFFCYFLSFSSFCCCCCKHCKWRSKIKCDSIDIVRLEKKRKAAEAVANCQRDYEKANKKIKKAGNILNVFPLPPLFKGVCQQKKDC